MPLTFADLLTQYDGHQLVKKENATGSKNTIRTNRKLKYPEEDRALTGSIPALQCSVSSNDCPEIKCICFILDIAINFR